MLQNRFGAWTPGFMFWAVFLPNFLVLTAAFLISHTLFWFLLFSICFSVLVVKRNRREKFLKSFYKQKHRHRKRRGAAAVKGDAI